MGGSNMVECHCQRVGYKEAAGKEKETATTQRQKATFG